MKDLVIIGAGGFGRTIYWQCDADYGNHREWTIKGFLDDRPRILDGFGIDKPILVSLPTCTLRSKMMPCPSFAEAG